MQTMLRRTGVSRKNIGMNRLFYQERGGAREKRQCADFKGQTKLQVWIEP